MQETNEGIRPSLAPGNPFVHTLVVPLLDHAVEPVERRRVPLCLVNWERS
jgi:hypothetical protein